MRITMKVKTVATLVLLASLHGSSTFAQGAAPNTNVKTFASVEDAAQALAQAARAQDEKALEAILGAGPYVLASADDNVTQLHRKRFSEKYDQMHRLVRETDGSTVLYVGAENWPFPFPLTRKNGQWAFDTNAGLEEILYRTIGENEMTAIDICQMLASPGTSAAPSPTSGTDPDAMRAHAQKVTAEPLPFYGYYFRKIGGPARGRGERAEVVEFVAYPTDYRSSGVMTFLVTGEGLVYQRDLGPQTPKAARSLKTHKNKAGWTAVSAKPSSK